MSKRKQEDRLTEFEDSVLQLHRIVSEIAVATTPIRDAYASHPHQVAIALWCFTQLVLGDLADDTMLDPALETFGQAYVDAMRSFDAVPSESALALRVVQLMVTRANKPGQQIVTDALSGGDGQP